MTRYTLTCVFLLGIITFANAQTGLQVSPVRLFFPERDGSTQTAIIRVGNPSQQKVVLQVSCADWKRDTLGEKQYYKASSQLNSSCPYLSFNPEFITLMPGQEAQVLTTLKMPSGNQNILRNGMIFLTQTNEKELAAQNLQSSGFIIRVQLGVHAYIIPTSLQKKSIQVTDITLAKKDGKRKLKVWIKNDGQLPMESFLRLELMNLDSDEEIKLDAVPFNSLPGEAFWVIADVPDKVEPGKYLISAIADSGPDLSLQVVEIEMKID